MTIKEKEQKLLKRIREGDKTAYIELVQPYSERLLRKAKSMTKNDDDAEDVVRAVTRLSKMTAAERTEVINQQEAALRQVVDFSPAHKIDMIEQHAKRG